LPIGLFLLGGVSLAQDQKTKLIRSVEIIRQDVFPEITGRPRFLYQWANSLHIVTRESVIRRMLLFEPGDAFDPELLAESERKLRQLAYIGEANIFVTREEERAVDVAVITQDQWSTLVSLILSQGGGRTIFGAGVEEFNLLGFGKQIFSEISHESREGTTLTLRYRDPQLFGSRWTTEEQFVTGPFIDQISAQVIRPFYALDTKWAGGVAASKTDETIRLFSAGSETSRLGLETASVQILGSRALGRRFNKTRLQLTYRYLQRDFSALGDLTTTPLPDDELLHTLTSSLSFENVRFVEEKQLDNFQRVEDITLGNLTTLSIGRSGLPIPKDVKRFEASFQRREAHQFFEKHYIVGIAAVQSLFEKDTIASLRLQYYSKAFRWQTLALNFEFDYGIDLESSRQFILGGDSGLRGYPAREFAGDKRLLLNVEDRIFTPLNVLTVALGGVLFFDAGTVWDDSVDLSQLNYSTGFGVRLGYTKSPNSRVGRIDFAWPLNRGGFGVSVGVDQQFTLN
jgi:outer membrane protein assembly factor BamA